MFENHVDFHMYNGVWVIGVAGHGELMCVGKDWHAFDPKVCTCTSAHLLLKGYCFVFCLLFYKILILRLNFNGYQELKLKCVGLCQ